MHPCAVCSATTQNSKLTSEDLARELKNLATGMGDADSTVWDNSSDSFSTTAEQPDGLDDEFGLLSRLESNPADFRRQLNTSLFLHQALNDLSMTFAKLEFYTQYSVTVSMYSPRNVIV